MTTDQIGLGRDEISALVKASGFGIPQHAFLWDAEAAAALRFGHVEVFAGELAFDVKTSTRADAYFKQRLLGAVGGVRWYWDALP